eukprot:scaffold628_cov91-Cylindrotheca_fusiformis.AAC.1
MGNGSLFRQHGIRLYTLHIAARYIWLRNDLDGIEDLKMWGKRGCGSKNRKTFDDLGYSLPKGRYLRRYSEWIYVGDPLSLLQQRELYIPHTDLCSNGVSYGYVSIYCRDSINETYMSTWA